MSAAGWLQVVLYFAVLLLLIKPLGSFMAHVYQGERTFLHPLLGPLERLVYRLAGIEAEAGMDWKCYAKTLLAFNLLGALTVYGLQRLHGWLPLDPAVG
ncbi:MAG: potassium-transporting ATPase subunit KdpA [Pseudomonadota bacterium]